LVCPYFPLSDKTLMPDGDRYDIIQDTDHHQRDTHQKNLILTNSNHEAADVFAADRYRVCAASQEGASLSSSGAYATLRQGGTPTSTREDKEKTNGLLGDKVRETSLIETVRRLSCFRDHLGRHIVKKPSLEHL
jgi:hypothetical protein